MVWLGVIQPYCCWNMPSSRKVKLYLTSHAILFWLRTGFPNKASSSHNPARTYHLNKPLKNNGPFLFSTCQKQGHSQITTKKTKKRKKNSAKSPLGLEPFENVRCKDWDLSLFLLAQVHVREPQGDVPKRNPTTPSRFFGSLERKMGFGKIWEDVFLFLGPKWMVYRYCWCFNDLFKVCWISTTVCITMLKRCEFYYIFYRYFFRRTPKWGSGIDPRMIWQLPKATKSLRF